MKRPVRSPRAATFGFDQRLLAERQAAATMRARQLVDDASVLCERLSQQRVELRAGRVACRCLVDRMLAGRLQITARPEAQPARRDPTRGATDRLVLQHTPLARSLARRYQGRGESLEDLTQVAMLGLVKAARRYDWTRGSEFSSFATITITGELKRHFRDRRWMMHVRRADQERYLATRDTVDRLVGSLGRAPTVSEVAAATGLTPEQVEDALETARALRPASIDAPIGESWITVEPGVTDPSFEQIDDRLAAAGVIATLGPQSKELLSLRFVEGLSQSEIAARVGVSQMHVSRMLAATLSQVRSRLAADGAL